MKKYLIVLAALAMVFVGCKKDKKDTTAEYTKIAFKQTELGLTPGEKAPLNVTWEPTDLEAPNCTWASSDEAVATVENGIVTAVAEGTANVTATVGDLKAVCKVEVVNGPFDLIQWGGWDLWDLDKETILSTDTFVTTISTGQEVHCVMIPAVFAIWDDDIVVDWNSDAPLNGTGFWMELPGTVWLITDDLGKGPNYHYLGMNRLEIVPYDEFNWNDTAYAYCAQAGKLGDAAKHLEWLEDETSSLEDELEVKSPIHIIEWNGTSGKYQDLFNGVPAEGVFVTLTENNVETTYYNADFSWFTEEDVLYGLKFEYDEETEEWNPKEPAEWGKLVTKNYLFVPEEEEEDEVASHFTVKAPRENMPVILNAPKRATDVLSHK